MSSSIRRPAKRHARPERAHAAHSFGVHGEPRTHADEKRALIHAHTHARAAARAGWGLSYYIGIGASCLVVVSGWWMTAGTRANVDLRNDNLVETVQTQTQTLAQDLHKPDPEAEAVKARIQAIHDQLEQAKQQEQQQP